MNVQDILNAILNINDADELRKIVKIAKIRDSELSAMATAVLKIGDRVVFDLPRHYKMSYAKGRIIKINKKTVRVETDSEGIWNVDANLIRKIPFTE